MGCTGRVIVTGMGKSGIVCRKIAATLSSTGTPAFFLHPAEALHGDLGAVQGTDVVVALSYGGETDELIRCWRLSGVLARASSPSREFRHRHLAWRQTSPWTATCPKRPAP